MTADGSAKTILINLGMDRMRASVAELEHRALAATPPPPTSRRALPKGFKPDGE